ncbi:DUF4268 domain-containing protein [Akkermansia muciniphila]|uniref:DUF4268 domain-containing protein n=1 Tax=Akkermansia muciniphila TaxID=239935 RepID=UPI001C94F140
MENKAAFDVLYKHKNEIESKLGTELQWKREDDLKSSKVFFQLDNVSIENEDNWSQMATFLSVPLHQRQSVHGDIKIHCVIIGLCRWLLPPSGP